MRVNFVLPLAPYSINRFYYGNKRIITADARDWIQRIIYAASAIGIVAKLAKIRENFDPKKHSISIQLVHKVPKSEFYSKKNEISAHVFDLTNWEKPLVDILFDKKYYGNNVPSTFENLNINDKFITLCLSKKIAVNAASNSIYIAIKILNRRDYEA